ncbi:hypothetical protein NUACC21_34010 [Scytonema sp. NUACC21]
MGRDIIKFMPYVVGFMRPRYFCTGWAIRSRTMLFTGAIHLLGILILPYIAALQFLTTGAVMVFCLFLLAELEWDRC